MEPVERFAAVRARLEQGCARDDALREAGLTLPEWTRLQRRCLGLLGSAAASGDATLADAYVRAFEAARRGDARPNPPAIPASPHDESPLLSSPPLDFVAPGVGPATPLPAPPTAPAASAPPPVQMPAFDLRRTVVAPDAVAAPALPFRDDGAPGGIPSGARQPSAPAAPRLSTGTVLAPIEVREVGPVSARPALDVTAAASDVPAGTPTPFTAADVEARGFTLMRYADLVAAREEGALVLGEFGLDAEGAAAVEGYWRAKMSTSIYHAANFVGLLADAKKARAAKRRGPVRSGTRLGLESGGAAASPGAGPAAPRDLTVDQYAWMTATLRRATAADLPAVLERLRLTAATRHDLEERWARRMAADPALREAFLVALARHLGATGT